MVLAHRCVFLDIERLPAAERSAPDSWRRPSPDHLPDGAGGPKVGGEQVPPVNSWSTEALARDFSRLSPLDYQTDGVYVHP